MADRFYPTAPPRLSADIRGSTATFKVEQSWSRGKLGMDPIELRVRNYAETDPESGAPWSSNALRQCYRIGAERFGWSRRNARPRATREGCQFVGFGVATAARAVNVSPAIVRVRLLSNGRAEIATAAQDIGTGTYTILAQIAGDVLGLPPDRIAVALGDTSLPRSPTAGGSTTAPSVGSATHLAAQEAKRQLARLAVSDARSSQGWSGDVDSGRPCTCSRQKM